MAVAAGCRNQKARAGTAGRDPIVHAFASEDDSQPRAAKEHRMLS